MSQTLGPFRFLGHSKHFYHGCSPLPTTAVCMKRGRDGGRAQCGRVSFWDTSEKRENKRLLRLSAILALFLGALSTGQSSRKPYGATSSLLAAATLKGLMVIMWCFRPRKAASSERLLSMRHGSVLNLWVDGAQNSQKRGYDPHPCRQDKRLEVAMTFVRGIHQYLRELVLDSSAVVYVTYFPAWKQSFRRITTVSAQQDPARESR